MIFSCGDDITKKGTTYSVPESPESVQASAGCESASISWRPVEGATSYNLYWKNSAGVTDADNSILSASSPYAHEGLTNGTAYYYAVTAVNIEGESGLSEEASATPDAAYADIPSAPLNVQAESGNQYIMISWTPVTGAVSYNIYWKNSEGVTKSDNIIWTAEMPYYHGYLTNYTKYYYAVAAVGFEGESGLSSEVSATPVLPFTGEIQKITASDAQSSDQFGTSAAICGEYIIAGAPYEDEGGNNAGAAYIFRKTEAGTWDAGIKLTANDAQADDYFGDSVAISGDYAIVGARNEDAGGSNAGAAYIFRRTGGADENIWDDGIKITASDAQANDEFGNSVSINGDYAIVGAKNEDGGDGNPTSNAGAAYIFHRTGANTWDIGTKIVASDPAVDDYFGNSVSISGDYAIVGSYGEDDGGSSAGAAYIYRRTATTTWDAGVKITATDPQAGDYFGGSVSISGDYAIVGASLENGGSGDPITGAGAAYIFRRTGTNLWDSGVKITATDPQAEDRFGYSVSISGDYAIAGARWEDEEGSNAGAAYIFKRTGTNAWESGSKITASDAKTDDVFGNSVSISGDYAIVGANSNDAGMSNTGAAYIFRK